MSARTTTYDLTAPPLFTMSIDRVPNVSYHCTKVSIPHVFVPHGEQATPLLQAPVPGNKIQFDPLNVSFLVTEDLSNYIEILKWIVGMSPPQNTSQVREYIGSAPNVRAATRSDVALTILTNKNNPVVNVTFVNAFPVSMTSLDYDSSVDDIQPMECVVTFKYDYFNINVI